MTLASLGDSWVRTSAAGDGLSLLIAGGGGLIAINSAKVICCSKTKRVLVIVLKYVLQSNGWLE